MNSVFATSIWLYLGDILWPATLVIGIASLCNLAATITKRHIVTTITAPQLQKFCYYQIAWLFAALVLFKAMILEGGPGFTHLVGTGNHGSVQFSTAGELAAAAATIYGLTRWVRWTMRHITTRRHAQTHLSHRGILRHQHNHILRNAHDQRRSRHHHHHTLAGRTRPKQRQRHHASDHGNDRRTARVARRRSRTTTHLQRSKEPLMAGSITAFVGGNGDGKTLGAMALHVSPALAKGRTVAATFDIIEPDTGRPHANSNKITEWRQLMQLRNCLLVLDEINAEFPSRGAMSLPPDLLRLLHQMRKPKVDVVWTAVNWARADVALREATQRVTVCNSYLPDKWYRRHEIATLRQPSGRRELDANLKPIRLDDEWPPGRLFRYRTYNANAFDDFTVHTMTKLRPIKTNWYWRPWHDDHYAYNTSETVPLMDNVSEAGVCLHCGGTRTRAKCTCPRPVRLAAPDAPAPEQDDLEEHDDE